MRDKIIEDYKILLSIGWMEADEDGNVSVRLGDDLMPATIAGKRVILPTRAQLKNSNWDNRIGFHPIREQYNLGVSDLLSCLRDQYVSRLNASIGYFMKELISIAYDQDNQKKLNSEQGQVLNALSKVSATTVKSFASILKNTSARNNADQFISIRIQRAGVVGGVTYGRAGLVQFPIYEKLKGPKDEQVNGVTLSDKDRNMLIKLYEFVMPSITTGPEAFSVGVSSRGAPFLESLVRASFNVISELVERSAPYMDLVALPSILQFPKNMGYWIEVFDSKDMVERLSETIPSMNEYTIEADEKPAKEKETTERRPEYRKSEERAVTESASESVAAEPAARRSFWGNASGTGNLKPTTSSQDRSVHAPRPAAPEPDRQSERARREELDRERRERDRIEDNLRRQEEAERRREDEDRRRKRDEEDRIRDRERDRDRDRGRDRDRDYDRRDDRDYDRDRKTGDVFQDNPLLRENARDRGRDDYYDRDRGRSGGRVRDIRDRDRGRDDYYDRDRDYDRGRRRG